MKRLGLGILFAIGGYALGAFAGYWLIQGFSPNTHDRSLEAAMTSAFVFGPLAAIVGFVIGFIRGGRSSGTTTDER